MNHNSDDKFMNKLRKMYLSWRQRKLNTDEQFAWEEWQRLGRTTGPRPEGETRCVVERLREMREREEADDQSIPFPPEATTSYRQAASEAVSFVVACLADCLAPSRESLALGPSGDVIDVTKEVPVTDDLRAAVPWLVGRRIEVFRLDGAREQARYGVRIFPSPRDADEIEQKLTATLEDAEGHSETLILSTRRATRVFPGSFAPDWSSLSFKVVAETRHAP